MDMQVLLRVGNETRVGLLSSRDPETHDSYVSIEPQTGATFSARKRLQLNVFLLKQRYQTLYPNLTSTMLPVFWLNEGATLNKYQETSLTK